MSSYSDRSATVPLLEEPAMPQVFGAVRSTLLRLLVLSLLAPHLAAQEKPQEAYALAAGLYDRGLHDRAAVRFRAFLARHPKHPLAPRARFFLGASLLRTGDEAGALAAFESYLADRDATFVKEARYRVGELRRRRGEAVRALEALDPLLASGDLGDLRGPVLLAHALASEAAGRTKAAKRSGSRLLAMKKVPSSLEEQASFLLARLEFRAKRFKQAVKFLASAGKSPEARYLLARSASALGNDEQAASILESLSGKSEDEVFENEVRFSLAFSLHRLGRYREASKVLTSLLAGSIPEDWKRDVVFARGEAEFAANRFEAAARDYAELARQPRASHGIEALYKWGWCLFEAGERDAALTCFEKVLAFAGDNAWAPDAAYLKALILDDKAEDAKGRRAALAAWEVAGRRARKPDERARAVLRSAWLSRDLGRHGEALEKAVSLTRGELPADLRSDALYLMGLEALQEGRPKQAIEALSRLVKEGGPHREEALLPLAMAFERSREPARAKKPLEAFLRGTTRGKARIQALYELGFVCMDLKDVEGAVRAFTALVEEAPGDALAAEALFRLGELHYEKKDFAAARRFYSRLARREDGGELRDKCLYKLGWSLRKLEKPAAAAKAFEAVSRIEESPLASEAAYLAGDAWGAAGEPARARTCFHAASTDAKGPYRVEAILREVVAAAESGDVEAVLKLAPRALAIRDEGLFAVEARSAWGDALMKKEQWVLARRAYRGLLQRPAGALAARAQFRIGLCFRNAGKNEEALDAWLKVGILFENPEWATRGFLAAADLLAARGEKDKAAKLLTEAASRAPSSELKAAVRGRLSQLAKQKEEKKR